MSLLEELRELQSRAEQELAEATSPDALEAFRIKYLGAKGATREMMRRLGEVSPDGRQLVLAFDDSVNASARGGLRILDIENGVAREIVAHGDSVNGEPGSVQWTPDGSDVVYMEMMHGDEWRTLVWRVAATGGEPEYLWTASQGKYGSWFELSPDGRNIALTTYTQETEVWVMEGIKEVLTRGN